MVENLETKVPIQVNLKKKLIFGMNARLPIALVVGLSGYCDEILPVMQNLSHSSRAFTINANGLTGFLVEEDFDERMYRIGTGTHVHISTS